jgi:hypothetical protein
MVTPQLDLRGLVNVQRGTAREGGDGMNIAQHVTFHFVISSTFLFTIFRIFRTYKRVNDLGSHGGENAC